MWVSLFFALASSALVAELMKRFVGRPRPSILDGAIIVGHQSSGFSFPSSHTLSAFAGFVILASFFPKWRVPFFLLAILIAFSRIYLGHHFPLDVVAGGLLGWGVGAIIILFVRVVLAKQKSREA